jgi:hypothetical protein
VKFPARLFFAVFLALPLFSAPPVFSFGQRDTPPAAPSGSAPPGSVPSGSVPEGASVPTVNGPGGELLRGGDIVELSGRVRLVGSEPFPDLVLTGGDDQDWYLDDASRQVLRFYEQRIVKVRGRVELKEMILANGRSLGFRRFLRDVEILSNNSPAVQ